jgi:hypothetical protein
MLFLSTPERSMTMASKSPHESALFDLMYQALETEQGGVKIYETALECAVNEELRSEWEDYLGQTRRHVDLVTAALEKFGLDPALRTAGREVVAGIGSALVAAMKQAKLSGTAEQAELLACEAVVLAETKDHANWELIGAVIEKGKSESAKILGPAYEEVEVQEDHHLYHTRGWCRELWLQALGFPAVLPPPEEVKNVRTAIGASRAEQGRDRLL